MNRLVGAFVFEHEWRSWTSEDARAFALSMREIGVESIVSESDSLDGDLLEAVRDEGLRWWAAVSLFSDHANANAVLVDRPELHPVLETGAPREQMEWYTGVIPTDERYTRERLAVVEELVRGHDPDGLILDFARWPLHWELECRPAKPQPLLSSYDEITLDRFRGRGIDVPTGSAREAARWIHAQAWPEWVEFRAGTITDVVTRAAASARRLAPSIQVGLFTLPLPPSALETLVGQRLRALGEAVDLVFPMTYHAILHRPPAWVGDIVKAHRRESSVPAVPVVQVDSALGAQLGADWGGEVSTDDWREVVDVALGSCGGLGLIAFPGSELHRPERGGVVRQALEARGGRVHA